MPIKKEVKTVIKANLTAGKKKSNSPIKLKRPASNKAYIAAGLKALSVRLQMV